MIFSEVIDQMLFERGIDYKALPTALGISALQVKNLQSGTTKMPSERICNQIIQYCKRHYIDIDLNWNDVLYDIFLDSESFRGYTWVRDLDEDGYVVLRHKACGRKTSVPKQTFAYKSTPCIHCWVEKYVSSDAYETDLSEGTDRHKFTHKCGHSYFVTYNEIKQKKFRCPDCTGYRYNVNNLRATRIPANSFEDEIPAPTKPTFPRSIPTWDKNLKERFDRIASKRGFSIEDRDSLHCRLHYPTMTDGQFAYICSVCFDSEVFDKNDSSVSKILDYANRHKTECEKPDDCLIENTKRQNLVWIPDVENILSMVALSDPEDNPCLQLISRVQGDGYSKTVYTAGAHNPDDDKTAHMFYHYINDTDATDYVNFLVSIAPSRFGEMTFHAFPKAYTDLLYEQILFSMNHHSENTAALQRACDEYVDIVNYFKQNNPQIFVAATFGKFVDILSGIMNKPAPITRKEDAINTLHLMHCPVCRCLHNSKAKSCTDCGFDELNKVFINEDEYELWLNQVVLPARKKHEDGN